MKHALSSIEGSRRVLLTIVGVMAVALAAGLVTPTFALKASAAPNPAGSLDQCANGGVGKTAQACSGAQWQNGNLNANQAHYKEGQSIPYRLRFSSLTPNSTYTVVIEWDTTKSGLHGLDYITSWDRNVEPGSDPCSGVTNCGSPTTYPIPADAHAPSGKQVSGVFTLYNGTITGLSAYSFSGTWPGGDSSSAIAITFTAGNSSPVLAWGGHVGSQIDWDFGTGAGSISGSPYHTRMLSLDGSGGNQDRSLAAAAVASAYIVTQKSTSPAGNTTNFDFSVSGGDLLTPDSFQLNGATGTNSHTTGPLYPGSYAVQESITALNWVLTGLSCTSTIGSSTASYSTVPSPSGGTATVSLAAGDQATCSFTNTDVPAPTATPTTVPTNTPTTVPSDTPTVAPTETPTTVPTETPTTVPTDTPTSAPTNTPTTVPTEVPTSEPTTEATSVPTSTPTSEPTSVPTSVPTNTPVPTTPPSDNGGGDDGGGDDSGGGTSPTNTPVPTATSVPVVVAPAPPESTPVPPAPTPEVLGFVPAPPAVEPEPTPVVELLVEVPAFAPEPAPGPVPAALPSAGEGDSPDYGWWMAIGLMLSMAGLLLRRSERPI